MGLSVGMQHPVEAALRTEIQAPVRQDLYDLAPRQRGEFGLVSGQQNSLALLFAETVSGMEVAALATVPTITGTSELPATALQCGEPDAQKDSQLMGTGAINNSFIKGL
jgi:hypothetical protein